MLMEILAAYCKSLMKLYISRSAIQTIRLEACVLLLKGGKHKCVKESLQKQAGRSIGSFWHIFLFENQTDPALHKRTEQFEPAFADRDSRMVFKLENFQFSRSARISSVIRPRAVMMKSRPSFGRQWSIYQTGAAKASSSNSGNKARLLSKTGAIPMIAMV